MKICQKCHLSFDDSANTCPHCGEALIYIPNQQDYREITDHTAEFTNEDISQNKILAMVPYIFGMLGVGVFGVIIALLGAGNSPYASFHVKQALKLQIVTILLGIVAGVLVWTLIVPILAVIGVLVIYVINIICFFDVCNGTAKEPALINKIKFLK